MRRLALRVRCVVDSRQAYPSDYTRDSVRAITTLNSRDSATSVESAPPQAFHGRKVFMFAHRWLLLAGCVALIVPATAPAADPPPTGPAYQIVLRSRTAEARPSKS